MKHLTLCLILALFYFSATAQVRLDVEGEGRVTGNYLELIKPSNMSHMLNLSSEGAAMDINATTDLYLNAADNINLNASNASGRVGIGTAAPSARLDVRGDFYTLSNRSSIFRSNRSDSDFDITQGSTSTDRAFSIHAGQNGGTVFTVFAKNPSNQFINAMLIKNGTGNIGIGTEPDRRVHIKTNPSAPQLRLEDPIGYFDLYAGTDFLINDESETRFFIKGSGGTTGNVGIGTTGPTSKLHVNGDARVTGNMGIGTTPSSLAQLNIDQSSYVYSGFFDNNRNTTGSHYGLYSSASASSTATRYGVYGFATGNGTNYGLYGRAEGTVNSGQVIYGVYGNAFTGNNFARYGVYGTAVGFGTVNYGIYGTATSASTNYAGYFNGNLAYTGTITDV